VAAAEASGNGAPSEAPPAPAPAATAEPPAAAPEPAAPSPEGNGGRAKASPVARRIAREHGVDLTTLQGTGPGGRIVKADVEAAASGGAPAAAPAAPAPTAPAPAAPAVEPAAPAAAEPAAAPPPAPATVAESGTGKGDVTIQELSRIQQVIARRMAESKATVPEFTITTEVDMEGAVELRAQLKAAVEQTGGAVPSYNDMVVKASAIALREFPRANGSYKDGHFELYSRVNIGVAVAAQEALIVPTVFDADRKSLGEIARDGRALAERVRAGAVTPPELSGGTFTVSNLGMFGITEFVAVINPPQAAILAVGKMEPRAVVRDGEIVARNTMSLTLACDHRILYGADAAEFLARIKALLERPIALAL
jgi:pyruvate dehydrogenase E2 component (dihydrolipoamide acetyltransferase)